jgi:hypothetical protein
MLTEVAGARRGWETAAARSLMIGVSTEAACRGRSASILLERPCVYGDGVVDLGKPWNQARAHEIWVPRWCPVHAEKEQRVRGTGQWQPSPLLSIYLKLCELRRWFCFGYDAKGLGE